MRRLALLLVLTLTLTACALGPVTGPDSFVHGPGTGWTKDEVRALWGPPFSVSYYGNQDTWLYRRTYMVVGTYANHLEHEYATVHFIDGRVVGVSY